MAGGRLKAAVFVQDPTTREELVLLPGDCPEPEVAVLISNPDAWEVLPGECGPEPIAVGEPDPSGPASSPDGEPGEVGGAGLKKQSPRRSRTSSASS
ncbi:hypothetical protein OHU45_25650 [Streptomyces tubercidicus]|uniref:hypothetical protein n=1 Tax=Streptomyces tubercidicus TaxID=47759 RepID=UPI0030E2FDB3